MDHAISPPPAPAASWRRDLLLLALGFGLLYFFQLGNHPLANPDEGRYAEIPREMVVTGDWITPRLNGVNYFEKPPLLYWTIATAYVAFGRSEWAMRATPALFALAGVLLTYAAARRMYGRPAGLMSALVLGTSLLYFALGHIIILDMAVSVLMSAALFCFILGVEEAPGARRRWLFYGLYAGAALATLTKGLIGFLIPGAVMFLWLLVFNQWSRLRPLYLPTGLLLFLAITVPWHVLAAQNNPTWFQRYIVFEHWLRFTTPVAARHGAWHYYIWIVLAGAIPWTGFLWPAVRDALRGGWSRRKENARAWFFVTWVLFIFLFFTKSHSKLVPYILPVFPALAVLVGSWLARLAQADDRARLRTGMKLFSFVCGVFAVALCLAVMRPGLVKLDFAQALLLRPPAFTMAAILLLGGILVPWLARVRGVRPALAGIVVTMTLFFGALQFAAPNIQKPGTKDLALFVKARVQPGDRVMHYHEFFHDFAFYAERVVDVVSFKGELQLEEDEAARASGRFLKEEEFRQLWTQPGRLFVVARKKDVTALFADPGFRYHLLAESPDHILFGNQP